MMQWMRDKMKFFLWFVILAFVATIFFVWGAGGKLGNTDNVLADVGRDKITHRELENSIRQLQEKHKQADPVQLRQYAFQQLVQRKLILKEADRMNVAVSREILKQRVKGYFTSDLQFKQALNSPQVPWAILEEDAKLSTTMEKAQELIRHGARATEPELKQAYLEDLENREVKWLAVNIEPSPEEDQTARQKAQEWLTQIKAGKDFATLAKSHSDDAGSKDNGGDLGYFKKGQMIPEFDKVAFQLKTGEISDLVKTKYGYHIIKVEEKRDEEIDDPDPKIKKKKKETTIHARHLLALLRPGTTTRDALRLRAEGLHQQLSMNSKFDEVAKQASASGIEKKLTRETMKLGKYDNAGPAIQQAFSIKIGESSKPVETELAFFVVQPLRKTQPTLEGFGAKRSIYLEKVLSKKSEELHQMWLFQLYQKTKIQVREQKG